MDVALITRALVELSEFGAALRIDGNIRGGIWCMY